MNTDNITSMNNTLINRKIIYISSFWIYIYYIQNTYTYPYKNPAFFLLLAVKSSETFPKRNGYDFISEFFALN